MTEDPLVLFDFPSIRQSGEDELPREREMPVLPLVDMVVFPHMLAPLFVSQAQGMLAIEEAMAADQHLLAVARRTSETSETGELGIQELYPVGVEAIIQRMLRMPDGTTRVVILGKRRMKIVEERQRSPAIRVRAIALESVSERTLSVQAMMRAVLSLFEKVVRLSRTLPDDAYVWAMNVHDPGWLADLIASMLPLDVARRQEILETLDTEERLRRLSIMLSQELDVLELENRIHNQVQKEVDRSQHEFFLREQLKAIQRELGQIDPAQREALLLRERILASTMPEHARARATEELERLETMPVHAPEYAMIRAYIDWLLDLPWGVMTEDTPDIWTAARILERNHYGLARVKERILEFIAVRQLAGPRLKTPIICFVGPPGVGKTSMGRSIAEALGRNFVRLSLGGIHDEAEIRGHRRTYIGAMPGRIIRTMKDARSINPVFLLDEIDKLGKDFRGDPAAALLEVLDPEQNCSFMDHYLDVAYDMSNVLFITTANLLDPIPDALLDRMEIIEIPGYTEEEKLHIARKFLIPSQWAINGLSPNTIRFGEAALREIIRSYTYEAGVRNLEREIGAICRKTARRIAEKRRFARLIRPSLVNTYLGPPRYSQALSEEQDEVGVATSMVWTSNGGDIMPVEVILMEGKGNLTLTGQLGEVMQESAQAALSYARANAKQLHINSKRFDKVDIHIHVPEGAIPKDGPSAGVTMAVALISAFLERPVRRDVAITGEITLRGKILPVGGIKEKVLGAYRAGIRIIILPQKNERELRDIPVHVRRKLTFLLVTHMHEALEHALCPVSPQGRKRISRSKKVSPPTAETISGDPPPNGQEPEPDDSLAEFPSMHGIVKSL